MMMRSHFDDGREETDHPRRPKASPCAGTLIIFQYASSVSCALGLGQCSLGGETPRRFLFNPFIQHFLISLLKYNIIMTGSACPWQCRGAPTKKWLGFRIKEVQEGN